MMMIERHTMITMAIIISWTISSKPLNALRHVTYAADYDDADVEADSDSDSAVQSI